MMSDKKNFKIAVLAGDGIGPEVIAEARRAVDAAASRDGASMEWVDYPFGATHYLKTGEILPESAIGEMARCDAMLEGAIGAPEVKPGILERGILIELRVRFDQYINLRPARSLPNVPTPVPLSGKLDSVVVRENTEDLYIGIGEVTKSGRATSPIDVERGTYRLRGTFDLVMMPNKPYAVQLAVNTKPGVERVARYACELARSRGEDRVTVVSKSNAVPQMYGFFEQTTKELMASDFPELKYGMVNVDAVCYHLARDPRAYGVLLCPNLFGDIVSDLQAALAGGLGTAAGANIGAGLSMFEPVHGSAPDIAGTGRANPIAAMLSGALMLDHLGMGQSARRIQDAVDRYLEGASKDAMPYEFGGSTSCRDIGERVISLI